jgi:hypothetical protein
MEAISLNDKIEGSLKRNSLKWFTYVKIINFSFSFKNNNNYIITIIIHYISAY